MGTPKFKVGQKVAFINNVTSFNFPSFKKGDVVTITSIIISTHPLDICNIGYTINKGALPRQYSGWGEAWFEAIIEAKYPSAIAEVITKFAPIEERSDIPIKITEPELEPA